MFQLSFTINLRVVLIPLLSSLSAPSCCFWLSSILVGFLCFYRQSCLSLALVLPRFCRQSCPSLLVVLPYSYLCFSLSDQSPFSNCVFLLSQLLCQFQFFYSFEQTDNLYFWVLTRDWAYGPVTYRGNCSDKRLIIKEWINEIWVTVPVAIKIKYIWQIISKKLLELMTKCHFWPANFNQNREVIFSLNWIIKINSSSITKNCQ